MRPLLLSCALGAALIPAIVPAAGAQPFQVADVNPDVELPPLFYFVTEPMATVGGELFFTQDDGVHGIELWKTDGTPGNEVLVTDLCPGACSGLPRALTHLGDRLLLFADDGEHGSELWATDGTAAGTTLIADLWPGAESGVDRYLRWAVRMGGEVYFEGRGRSHGPELWKTDGTTAGTTLVADIRPGPEGSLPIPKVTAGGLLLLDADDGTHGREPWVSDGTAAGTRLLKDLNPGAERSTYPNTPFDGPRDSLATSGGLFVFRTNDGLAAGKVWASDGTEAGTVLLRDFSPGGVEPGELTEMAGTVYFSAATGAEGHELWRTDGTPAGTSLVKDIQPGPFSSIPQRLTVSSGRLFFRASTQELGFELWTSDGTEAGTTLVKDIWPGNESSLFYPDPAPVDFNGTLLFFANDGVNGLEIWKSDGTEAGTVLVSDFSAQAVPIQYYLWVRPTPFAGRLVFRAFDPAQNQEVDLWVTDGTAAGTGLMVETTSLTSSIQINPWDGTALSPQAWRPLGDKLFFPALDSDDGHEPWISDGTQAGTRQLADTAPGLSWSSLESLVPLADGRALFSADGLWATDGTPAGTAPLFIDHGPRSVRELTRIGGLVFFSGHLPNAGPEIWKTDGTAAGTSRVADILPGADGSGPSWLQAVENTLLFAASGGPDSQNKELWKSDGTLAGTVRVRDIAPGAASSLDETTGRDTTAVLGSTLFFVADDLASGPELWASDGTEAGTRRVKDVRPGARGAEPQGLTAAGNRLFFSADDGTHGRELWVSDGTEAGTVLVEDILPGAGSSLPRELAAVDRHLLFSAFDEEAGVEPWVSDGTAEGTRRLGDIAPGPLPSSPVRFTAAGDNVYFGANDAVTGSELWAIPQDEIDPGLDFYTVAPCRAVDTRTSSPLLAGTPRTFLVAGLCGIPTDAKAVAVNLTVFHPTALGNLVAWAAGQPTPGTSSLNFLPGVNRANNAFLELNGGEIQALARMPPGGEVHLIVDVVGYFSE